MAPGPEIQAYFRQVATERGIRPHIRFGSDVTSARYRDGQWWVSTADGEEAFDVLITATGVLRVPRYPDIPGLGTFAGPVFHSSRWDHSVTLPDKRIGLVGTGSTGVQITAELGGKVRELTIFQRTPQWVLPMPNGRYSRVTRAAMQRWPALARAGYRVWKGFIEKGLGRAAVEPCWQRRAFAALCRLNLRVSVRDPELRRRLTPDYQAMWMWWINQIRDGRVVAAAPTEAATKDYNEEMKAAMPQTVWTTGCKSWYLGKDGLPEFFPWTPVRHRELLATPEAEDFDVRTA